MLTRKTVLKLIGLAVLFLQGVLSLSAAERPRLAVLTDIGGDPDDQQSLVRLMVYANEFEIETLIASASGIPGELKQAITRPDLIREIIGGYEKVLPRLQKHAAGWPEADGLRRCVKSGNPHRGRKYIGAGHDTEGSRVRRVSWLFPCASREPGRGAKPVVHFLFERCDYLRGFRPLAPVARLRDPDVESRAQTQPRCAMFGPGGIDQVPDFVWVGCQIVQFLAGPAQGHQVPWRAGELSLRLQLAH